MALREINLRRIARDDCFAAKANASEEHLHLFRRRVLRFVQDHKGVIQCAPSHIGKRCDLNGLFLEKTLYPFETHQVVEGVIEWSQIRVYLLCEISGQKTKSLTGLNSWACQDQPLHSVAFHGINGTGDSQPGFTGTRRSNTKGNVVLQNIVEVIALTRCPRT